MYTSFAAKCNCNYNSVVVLLFHYVNSNVFHAWLMSEGLAIMFQLYHQYATCMVHHQRNFIVSVRHINNGDNICTHECLFVAGRYVNRTWCSVTFNTACFKGLVSGTGAGMLHRQVFCCMATRVFAPSFEILHPPLLFRPVLVHGCQLYLCAVCVIYSFSTCWSVATSI